MLLAPVGMVSGLTYITQPGDILNLNETPQVIALDAVYTFLGTELSAGDCYRTLMTAARADVFPTAQQLINALMGNLNQVSPPSNELYGVQPTRAVNLAWPGNIMPIQPGSTFRRRIVATTAFALNMAFPANSGIAAAAAPFNTVTVAASTWREFLFLILNSSPTTVISVTNLTASKILNVPAASLDLINNITQGMSVYGTNMAAGAKVTAVNRDTGVISVDTNTTGANAAQVAITFTPTVAVYGMASGTL